MNEAKFRKLWSRIDAKIKSKELKPLKGINSVDDFLAKMAKQENRKSFWNAVNVEYAKVGIFLGEWEDFEQLYGGDDKPLAKYEGVYEESTIKIDVTVRAKEDKLVGTIAGFDFEFKNKGTNTFTNDSNDVEIIFTQDGSGAITGAKLTTTSITIKKYFKGYDSLNFIKKSSTPPKPDEPTPPKPPSVWDCIENYNKENNSKSLYDRDEYRYEKVDLEHDNKPTIFKYYKDGRVDWAYYADQKPILQGKWECRGDNGYIIKWSNGKISTYNVKTGGGLEGNSDNTTTTTLENICPNGYKEGCVTEEDILNKKKALKICRKCDLVKKVQENPEIKARIFRIQKELGKEQKTDNVFGPIMLAAIKEYQSSHGINPTGAVGEKTLSKINSYTNSKVEEPKVNNNEPVINKTDVKNEPVIKKTDDNSTNKPQVKPIYRRSSRQVLRPDEEL